MLFITNSKANKFPICLKNMVKNPLLLTLGKILET